MEQNNPTEEVPFYVRETKQWRKDLDEILQRIKDRSQYKVVGTGKLQELSAEIAGQLANCDHQPIRTSPERDQAIIKLKEAIMWLGMDLKEQGTPPPYPQSYNPDSPRVEKPDGVKL